MESTRAAGPEWRLPRWHKLAQGQGTLPGHLDLALESSEWGWEGCANGWVLIKHPGPESQHFRSILNQLQQAMNTIHELQFAREFKKAVRDVFPQLFLAHLAQMHYILELNQPTEPEQGQKAQETAVPSPQR